MAAVTVSNGPSFDLHSILCGDHKWCSKHDAAKYQRYATEGNTTLRDVVYATASDDSWHRRVASSSDC